MPVVEPITQDRLQAGTASHAAETSARHGASAAILAGVAALGLAVFLAIAVFVMMGLIFSPGGWSSLMLRASGGG